MLSYERGKDKKLELLGRKLFSHENVDKELAELESGRRQESKQAKRAAPPTLIADAPVG